jgi:diguanylate cyclase (GGDEF)-like protein
LSGSLNWAEGPADLAADAAGSPGLSVAALDALPAHVAILDQHGVIRATNRAWNRFASENGLACRDFGIGTSYLAACDSATGDAAEVGLVVGQGLRRILQGERSELSQVCYTCHAPAVERWFSIQACRLPDGGAVVIHSDVTLICQEMESSRRSALQDPLTGLPNRLLLQDRLATALAHAKRMGLALGVLMIDLDSFKQVNDGLGHAAGDRLLQLVAGRMRGRLREADTLARLGGDEFAAVLPGVRHRDDLATVADDLLSHVQLPARGIGAPVTPSLSIGGALYPSDGRSAAYLLSMADRAMYRAKRQGGSRTQLTELRPLA